MDLDVTPIRRSDVKLHLNFLAHLPIEMIESSISGTAKWAAERIESGGLELRQLRFEPPALMPMTLEIWRQPQNSATTMA